MNEIVEPHTDKFGSGAIREVYDWAESVITSLLCVIVIFIFIGQVVNVDGPSMLPTLHEGERLICVKLGALDSGDIVVIAKPGLRSNPLIKRIIAVGGQTIDIDFEQGIVFVDGVALDEKYVNTPTNLQYIGTEYPFTVPEGHVFVMGDNRNESWDSRSPEVGTIDRRYVLGHVIYRVAPFDKIGRTDQ